MSAERSLALVGSTGVREPPPNRGALINCHEVAAMVGRSADWVRRNVPGKRALGHSTKRWYRDEVLTWIDSTEE